jgi:hypothetical protein
MKDPLPKRKAQPIYSSQKSNTIQIGGMPAMNAYGTSSRKTLSK